MSSLLHEWWFVLPLGGTIYLHDFLFMMVLTVVGFPSGLVVKNPSACARDSRDVGSIPELGRSPGVGNGKLLQYSCLGNFRGGKWIEDLQGHSLWGHKELDMTEHTHT